MSNIALRLKYDGSAYHGWQIQKKDITVAQTLETALGKVYGQNVKVIGCGRTDAGVHANCYCANYHVDNNIPLDKIPLALNTRLPDDIAVELACEAPDEFNAIGSCIKKEYVYKILNDKIKDPFLHNRVCFFPQEIDFELLQRAAKAFEGTHDFKAVRSVGTETKTTVRTVFHCNAKKEGNLITIAICADGFLYNMCRAMVGTMIYCSYGKLDPEDIPKLLEIGDRRLTGPTMPPQGLYMNRLWYEDPVGKMFETR